MRFEASATSILVTATAEAPLVAFRCPVTERMGLREIGVTLQAATSSRLALVRPTTVSVTPTGNFVGRAKNPLSPSSASTLVTGWTTAPVIPASAWMRRITLPAAIGAGFIWTWPADDPLYVGNGVAIGEIAIINLVAVAPSLFDFYAVWED